MPSLLDSGQNDPSNPITSLLGSVGSALSGGVAQPSDTQASMASFLAAASAMANAGAPTLGPPTTTAQAILGSLGAGRSAAISNEILPFVQRNAMMQQQEQQLEYETKLFNYNRQRAYYDLIKQGVGLAPADASAPPPAAPGANVAAPMAPGEPPNYAALPDVQALPDQTRAPVISMMTQVGMGADEAAQYARMLMAESNGLHIDPSTKQVTMNKGGSGATGVAQVMPNTFTDMQKKYNIPGSNTDLVSNLSAGGHYFHDQVLSNGGDLRLGTMAYDMGPQGLADWQAGKKPLPAETSDYLVKTGAPPPPTVAASTGPMTPSMNRAIGPNADPLVADPATGELIPRSQYLAKQPYQVASSGSAVPGPPTTTSAAPPASSAAPGAAADPMVPDVIMRGLMVPKSIEQAAMAEGLASGPEGHAKVIQDYVLKKALMPTYTPTGVPGVQVSSQGETSAAPPGTASLQPLTAADRAKLFPGGMDRPVLGTYTPGGILTGLNYPEVPEPQTILTDEQARLPVDQGGIGPAYRTGASYQRGGWSGKVTEVPVSRSTGPPLPDPTTGVTPLTGPQSSALNDLSSQANGDPRIQNFLQQLTLVGRMNNLAGDPSRTAQDDVALLKSFFKFNDPGAVVHQDGEDLMLETGGPGQRVQSVIAHSVGGRFLTPDTVQNVVNTVNTEAEGARSGFTVASNNYRQKAQMRGLNADLVTPDPEATIQQYQAQWKTAQQRLQSGQGVGGQTPVPGAAPTARAGTAPPVAPAAPPPAATAPNTGPPAATDRLSDAGLGLMTPQGLTALGQDMQRNPGNYSAHDRQLYIDHLAKR